MVLDEKKGHKLYNRISKQEDAKLQSLQDLVSFLNVINLPDVRCENSWLYAVTQLMRVNLILLGHIS